MKKNKPSPTKFVDSVTVIDPDTGGGEVVVEIRKNLATGAMVGLDGSWLESFDDNPCDPYNPGCTMEISEDEYSGVNRNDLINKFWEQLNDGVERQMKRVLKILSNQQLQRIVEE